MKRTNCQGSGGSGVYVNLQVCHELRASPAALYWRVVRAKLSNPCSGWTGGQEDG